MRYSSDSMAARGTRPDRPPHSDKYRRAFALNSALPTSIAHVLERSSSASVAVIGIALPSGRGFRSDRALAGARDHRGRVAVQDRLARLGADLGLVERVERPVD